MNTLRCFITMLALCSGISACNYNTLYSDLDEQQANEMLALLLRASLDAQKNQRDKSWELQVSERDLPTAVTILKSHGYPRDKYQSLGDVFKKEGFVSSPLEERARLLHGLSQELSRTISEIDGVVVARVHLAIPEKDVLSEKRAPSSASIFIKHRAESTVTDQLGSIKALVVNSVEGLPYENVTVTLFQAEFGIAPVPGGNSVKSSAPEFLYLDKKTITVFSVLFALLVLSLICLKVAKKNPGKSIVRHISR